ncbi:MULTISPECIES: hypothetical protein [unclassified Streptomyces]|uniref:hypothetical protein n=1 Tax=unclassified Streptomyces TaxID=2593676 RepID=UPI002250BBAA|nr:MULTISPECIES: hypothetical protein [unclassified Streptomyces]MCX4650280.1 hypothetical protein [Streptomyces sp. NBC_01446]MCX5321599.1 hypothetical protein [Streptomyces sp. NBC_00120]MCX5323873.1 hypothetical protein [Streptomyces sp. NBC_00120]MCX5327723.1 hypothetical protein [Streptomyces sp. NBC_00120]
MANTLIPDSVPRLPVDLVAEPTLGSGPLPRLARRLELTPVCADRPDAVFPKLDLEELQHLNDLGARDQTEFFVVRLGCDLLPGEAKDAEPFDELGVFFKFESLGAPRQPTAWNLAPQTTSLPVKYGSWSLKIGLSAGGVKLGGEMGRSDREAVEETVIASKEGSHLPRWTFYSRPVQPLSGQQLVTMLVHAPLGQPVTAEVRVSAKIRVKKYGVRNVVADVPAIDGRTDLRTAQPWGSTRP